MRTQPPTRPSTRAAIQLRQPKDPATAVLLEVLPALVGFSGIGWIYAGNVPIGLFIMFCYWVAIAGTIVAGIFSTGLCCIPLVPIVIGGVAFSAYNVYKFTVNMNAAIRRERDQS